MPSASQSPIESMSTVLSQTIINTTLSNNSIEPLPLTTALPVALILASIVILCLFGNVLVILAVFTFRPLRTVQNFFIVSLAFSDMLVAIMVMPFHIVKHIVKRWIFGKLFSWINWFDCLSSFICSIGRFFCQVFVTSDVLLCTASILNLCAIAVNFSLQNFHWIKRNNVDSSLARSLLGYQWSDSICSSTDDTSSFGDDYDCLDSFSDDFYSAHYHDHSRLDWT